MHGFKYEISGATMNEISLEQISLAYKKLKQYAYYNKNDLHIREKVSVFEADPEFKRRISKLHGFINGKNSEGPQYFNYLLSEIDFRATPKTLEISDADASIDEQRNSDSKGTYISNISSGKSYEVKSISYFFNGPIELHLICVLWLMIDGFMLDKNLGNDCYGSRLVKKLNDLDNSDGRLFVKYHELYSNWRDRGIKKARRMLENEHENVAIIGMDIKTFFYSCDIDFRALGKDLDKICNKAEFQRSTSAQFLLSCIEKIHNKYNAITKRYKLITHESVAENNSLPIGLCSSAVIANWYLREFDNQIVEKINPAYYGRYIDDILIVIKDSTPPHGNDPIRHFINKHFINKNILKHAENNNYKLVCHPNLILQQDKCILQYFDSSHSIASLEKFQKKIESNGSDVLLLSIEEEGNSLIDVAYDLLYNGSINKFRSVKGIAENRYELSKYLAKKTIDYLLTGQSISREDKNDILSFFKGKCAIEFYDLWEKVIALYVIAGNSEQLLVFKKSITTNQIVLNCGDI